MKATDEKAVRLVLDGSVQITRNVWDGDDIETVDGWVTSGTNIYEVRIRPDHTDCNCQWGQHRTDASGHSHDQAVRLQAYREHMEGPHA